jgi:hypothetical protein
MYGSRPHILNLTRYFYWIRQILARFKNGLYHAFNTASTKEAWRRGPPLRRGLRKASILTAAESTPRTEIAENASNTPGSNLALLPPCLSKSATVASIKVLATA